MGEPVAGDICDPIRVLTTVVSLKTGIVGLKGDFLVADSTNNWFTKVTTTTVGAVLDAVTDLGVVQAQEDFDTTGIADGIGTVAAFQFQSRIYAPIAAGVGPGAKVALHVLVDDSPGPAIVGFGLPVAVTALGIGRYIKMSGATVGKDSTPANGIAIIDMGAA